MVVNINLEKPVSILGLYEKTAEAAGINPKSVKGFNCTEISVSKDLFDSVKEYYKIYKGCDYTISFGMDWICYGPKVDEELYDGEVQFTDNFIVMMEE